MMSICKTCENSYCHYAKTDVNQVVSCSGYTEPKKPTTNADRIRAITENDDVLAEALMSGDIINILNEMPWCKSDCGGDESDLCPHPKECCMRWLQQPAEVE